MNKMGIGKWVEIAELGKLSDDGTQPWFVTASGKALMSCQCSGKEQWLAE